MSGQPYLRVMVEKMVSKQMEQPRFLGGEKTIMDLIDGLLQFRVSLIVLTGNVAECV